MKNMMESIKRTPYQSLASYLVLFFTLFITLFFFTLTTFFYETLSYVETIPQVNVYFQSTVSESDVFKYRDELTQTGKVASIKYISKDQALKIYQEMNKKDDALLELVTADILPQSLEIYATKPEYLQDIALYLKDKPGIDEILFQKDMVNKLMSINDVLRKVATFTFVFLLLLSFVVLITTTAFKIALKKDEIELMQLLGATKSYVRRPYLTEGAFFGLVSATSAFLLFYALFFSFKSFFDVYLAGLPKFSFFGITAFDLYVWPPSISFIILSYFIILLFGVIIGLIGNYFSASKYIE